MHNQKNNKIKIKIAYNTVNAKCNIFEYEMFFQKCGDGQNAFRSTNVCDSKVQGFITLYS